LNLYTNGIPLDIERVKTVVSSIFPSIPTHIERITEGVSTYVYRIASDHKTWYLRVLPEEGASFVPEAMVHARLREMQVKVPEVIYVEPYNDLLQRSIMVTTEIPGRPIGQSQELGGEVLAEIVREAGHDLACINSMIVEGFGWVKRDPSTIEALQGEWPTYREFVDEYWNADLAYLTSSSSSSSHVLSADEIAQVERVRATYDSWLDVERGYLVHGDFDTTHIYQEHGRYTGIIDFGEIRGADRWYDLAQFYMREREQLPWPLEAALIDGYEEVVALPEDYEQRIHFTSLLTNVRALSRSLQKRPPNHFSQHQLKMLRENLAVLLMHFKF
jgi:aminoglycoside phosphotransferase (APT) family kinase protein